MNVVSDCGEFRIIVTSEVVDMVDRLISCTYRQEVELQPITRYPVSARQLEGKSGFVQEARKVNISNFIELYQSNQDIGHSPELMPA